MFLRSHSRVHFFPLIENGLLVLANVLLLLGRLTSGIFVNNSGQKQDPPG